MEVARYQEVRGRANSVRDILTNRYYDISRDLELKPRQTLILQYKY